MPRLIVSAGHTTNDPGSQANGLKEAELTRLISRKIVPHLRASGIITLAVPPDLELNKRIDWINGTGYKADLNDIAIEIHINDGGKSGFEFWHKDQDSKSQNLAQTIMDSVTAETGLPSQGVKSEKEHEFGTLAFLNSTNTISVLLECLYIDNADDAKKLANDNELDKVAQGIAMGVCKHLNLQFRPASKTTPNNTQTTVTANASLNSPVMPTRTMPAIDAATQQPVVTQTNTLNNPVNNPITSAPSVNNTPQPVVNPTPQPINNFNPAPIQQPTTSFNSQPSSPMNNDFQPINGGFGNNSFGGNNPPAPIMSREDRKKMIEDIYKKILGREPNQNDLNYFLNIGITEDKLIKRMIDSQEHLDLVNAKKEFDTIKKDTEKQKIELTRLNAENNDIKIMLTNLQRLLQQKNVYISRMKYELSKHAPANAVATKQAGPKYTPKLSDRIFHFFSNLLN